MTKSQANLPCERNDVPRTGSFKSSDGTDPEAVVAQEGSDSSLHQDCAGPVPTEASPRNQYASRVLLCCTANVFILRFMHVRVTRPSITASQHAATVAEISVFRPYNKI